VHFIYAYFTAFNYRINDGDDDDDDDGVVHKTKVSFLSDLTSIRLLPL